MQKCNCSNKTSKQTKKATNIMTVKSYVNLHEQKDKQLGIFPVSVVYSTNIFTLESPCQY
jgi:hypothetical protein